MACVRKYFKLASDDILFLFFKIKGIKDNRLISIASHAINQELVDITKIIENIKDIKNKIYEGCKKIN